MGCTSSTEVDPSTGKEKKKMGGAYPGNRRPQQAPYAPPQSDFQKTDGNTNTAIAHFVAYGGGNALVLVDHANAPPHATSGGPPKEYISVTLPEGVSPGDTIHVQSPDGRLNAIVVPDGMYPGSTFTVEFASAPKPPPSAVPVATGRVTDNYASGFNNTQSSSASRPAAPAGNDDGFVSGFNNPNASAVQAEPYIHTGQSYPTAPAYNPSYNSRPY